MISYAHCRVGLLQIFSCKPQKKNPDIPGGGDFGKENSFSKEDPKKETADFRWLVHEVELEEMNKRLDK